MFNTIDMNWEPPAGCSTSGPWPLWERVCNSVKVQSCAQTEKYVNIKKKKHNLNCRLLSWAFTNQCQTRPRRRPCGSVDSPPPTMTLWREGASVGIRHSHFLAACTPFLQMLQFVSMWWVVGFPAWQTTKMLKLTRREKGSSSLANLVTTFHSQIIKPHSKQLRPQEDWKPLRELNRGVVCEIAAVYTLFSFSKIQR